MTEMRRLSPLAREIGGMTAVEIASKVNSKMLSATEVAEASLERLDAFEPHIHAFSASGHAVARAAAKAVDARIASGEYAGPLAGVPVGIKDLVATKDMVTSMGSTIYKDFVPEEDDIVVDRLRRAGALVIGKTNVPELGYSPVGHNPVFETTRNPWNLAMTPGGSSAGSGASVACGVSPFAIGSDGGGSVRIPAAHCGLYGIKASMGRVPLYPGCRDARYPGLSSWESLEHIGPLSRTVADSALMLSVIAGPDPRDRHSIPIEFDWMEAIKAGFKGKKIAFSQDFGYAAVDPRVREIVQAAARVFETDLGCRVIAADPGWDDPLSIFGGLVAADSDLAGMRKWLPEHAHNMSPHLVDMLSKPFTAEDLTNANIGRKALCTRMAHFMDDYDLLLTPTLAVPPFPIGFQGPEKTDGRITHPSAWLSFTFPTNMTGQPSATVPAGWTEDGLPVGLQIVGRHLDDATVLAASAAFEAARPWKDKWPALVSEIAA